jgi:hypothetical protein
MRILLISPNTSAAMTDDGLAPDDLRTSKARAFKWPGGTPVS